MIFVKKISKWNDDCLLLSMDNQGLECLISKYKTSNGMEIFFWENDSRKCSLNMNFRAKETNIFVADGSIVLNLSKKSSSQFYEILVSLEGRYSCHQYFDIVGSDFNINLIISKNEYFNNMDNLYKTTD